MCSAKATFEEWVESVEALAREANDNADKAVARLLPELRAILADMHYEPMLQAGRRHINTELRVILVDMYNSDMTQYEAFSRLKRFSRITLEFNSVIIRKLMDLEDSGLYGNSPEEVVDRLVCKQLGAFS